MTEEKLSKSVTCSSSRFFRVRHRFPPRAFLPRSALCARVYAVCVRLSICERACTFLRLPSRAPREVELYIIAFCFVFSEQRNQVHPLPSQFVQFATLCVLLKYKTDCSPKRKSCRDCLKQQTFWESAINIGILPPPPKRTSGGGLNPDPSFTNFLCLQCKLMIFNVVQVDFRWSTRNF